MCKQYRIFFKYVAFMLSLSLILIQLSACKEPVTLRIAIYASPYANAEEQNTRVNAYLATTGSPYRVEFTIFTPESIDQIAVFDEYDLVSCYADYTCTELEETFLDISDELKNGALQSLYQSMPEIYWQTLSVNGHIYNTINQRPAMTGDMIVYEKYLKNIGVELTDEVVDRLTGNPLQDWSPFLAEVYEKNDQQPFMIFLTAATMETPLLFSFYWTSAFRLITPYIGIPLDNDELEAVCIYDSDYAETMKDFWKDCMKNGYLIKHFKGEMAMGPNQCFDTIARIRDDDSQSQMGRSISIPFQSQMMAYAKPSGMLKAQLLIPKTTKNQAEVFEFLNDLSQDPELARLVCTTEEDNRFEHLTPNADQFACVGRDTYLTGTPEENLNLKQLRFDSYELAPIPEFVFDPAPVSDQIEKIQLVFDELDQPSAWVWRMGSMERWESYEEWADYWDEGMDGFIQQLYDAGMQDVLDEVNRQIKNYAETVG